MRTLEPNAFTEGEDALYSEENEPYATPNTRSTSRSGNWHDLYEPHTVWSGPVHQRQIREICGSC